MKWLHDDLTRKILNAYSRVYRLYQARPRYSEANLREALKIELEAMGLKVQTEVVLPRLYRGKGIGSDRLDLIVEDKVIVELKKVAQLTPEHREQLQMYLQNSQLAVGLLLKFGDGAKEIVRVFEHANAPRKPTARD